MCHRRCGRPLRVDGGAATRAIHERRAHLARECQLVLAFTARAPFVPTDQRPVLMGTGDPGGVGAYIALAGLWASPVSVASMNPARSLGPALAGADLHQLWIYLTAPPLGMLVAVAAAYILRGPGGGPHGIRAAQGKLPGTAPR
jgi:Major intrinsic protein